MTTRREKRSGRRTNARSIGVALSYGRLPTNGTGGRAPIRASAALDVGPEHVRRFDEERPLGQLGREARGEQRVDLEREDADAPVEERPREGAAAGPDLDDRLPLGRAQGVENFFDRSCVDEEMLTPAEAGTSPRA